MRFDSILKSSPLNHRGRRKSGVEEDPRLAAAADEQQAGSPDRTAETAGASLGRLSALQSLVITRGERLAVGLAMAIFLSVAVITALHLIWTHQHMRPNVRLTEDLRAVATSPTAAASGLAGYRIAAANGLPVSDLNQLDTAIGAGSGRHLLAELVPTVPDGNGSKRTFWWETREAPRFALDPDGLILAVDPVPPEGAPGVANARLLRINGTPLDHVTDPESTLRRNAAALRLTLLPLDSTQRTFDLVIARLDWRVQFTLLLVGFLIGCLGFGVYRLKPDIASSWGFLAFCLTVSLFWMFRSIPHHYRWPLESQAFYLLMCSLPFASLCFLGTFSPLRVLFTSLRPPLWSAAGFGILLLALNQVLYPADAAAGILGTPLFLGHLGIMLAMTVLSQQTRLWFRLRGLLIGPTDRQRAMALRLAGLLGFVPLIAFYVAMVSQRVDLVHRLWFELAVLAFPMIVAYAIVRHNLLQLNELAREGLAIGLLMLSLGLVYATATAAVGPLTERLLGAGGELSQGLLVGASALVLAPLYARTRRRFLHRFHRADHLEDYLHTLADLADRQRNLDTFCDEAVLITSSALSRAGASLLLRQTSTGVSRAAASTVDPRPTIDLERCRPLLQILVQTRAPLDQNEILEGRLYRHRRRALLTAWGELDAMLLVPLRCQDRLVGALVIGSKPGGASFTAPELRFVDGLGVRIATGLGRWFTPAQHDASTITGAYPAYPEAIGHYRVDRLLGEGAMCYVYLARDDDREVAIKVPKPETRSDDLRLERFLRESRAMKRIPHPHIVRILGDGTAHDELFIVIEYFPDGSFNRYLKRERTLDEIQALGLIRDLATGLEAAFGHGIVHRDLKPANIFLAQDGRIKIGDFGIANLADEATLTDPGSILGTPAYMSPEVARATRRTPDGPGRAFDRGQRCERGAALPLRPPRRQRGM